MKKKENTFQLIFEISKTSPKAPSNLEIWRSSADLITRLIFSGFEKLARVHRILRPPAKFLFGC